jgi:AcrR family transcriptional regulator
MTSDDTMPTGRAQKKDAVRASIADALIELLAEGASELNHDRVADRAGIARRTVYRYFPDREALMQAAWERVTALAGPNVTFPTSEADLLATLKPIHEGFDRIAPISTVVRSTPQGRAIRLSQRGRRVASYTAAAADAVKDLSPEDRLLATAMLQVLHTTPWLEMRDHWELDGTQIARACDWAIRALLADLRRRGDRPLDAAIDDDRPSASAAPLPQT